MYRIFTDTDADITPVEAAKYGYQLISMPYSIDGNTVYPYEDFETFDSHAFYDVLRGGVLPTTSAISEERYKNYFEPVFAAGEDVLYVHFSRAMSATFAGMDNAVKALLEKYPGRKFYSIDTKGITLLSYNIACEVGQMYLEGKTPEEILAWAEREVSHFTVYFFADDLKFFKKSGRVSGLAAMMGTLIGVRPIIFMNDEGKMVSIGKERGKIRAMEKLISIVEELGVDLEKHQVVVGHTDAPDLAEGIVSLLREKFGDGLNIVTVVVNPTAGSHCGPNTAGVCFYAKHR